ncbi:MAG: extracellular solute-binding protein, partial [Chloroflexales bacterium]|nr:extracellular solute-binding protein [Chloroflexales bacterium]
AAQSTDSAPVYGLLDDTAGVRTLFGEFTATASDETDATDAAAHLDHDTVRMIAAVERTIALLDSGVVYLDPAGVAAAAEAADIGQLIRDQRIGIWPVPASPTLLDSPDWPFALGIIAMPALRPPGLGESAGYIMSSGTRHPAEAWRWLAFLSRQSNPNLSPDPAALQFFPARPAVLEGSAAWAQFDAETRATLEAALQRPGSASGSPPDSALLESMHQTLHAVVTDEASLDQALRAAQARLTEHREQAQTPLPDSAPVVVATPAPIVTPPEGATTITFRAYVGPGEDIFPAIVEAFNAQNLGVFVALDDTDLAAPLTVANVAAATDCFAWFGPPDDADLPALLDLQPLIDADTTFAPAEYHPTLLAAFQHDDGVYGLPYLVKFRVLNFNQTMFDAANLAYPTIHWTLDDLLNAAQQLTNPARQEYGIAVVRFMPSDFLFYLDQFDVALARPSPEGPLPNFTDPAMRQAVRFYVDLLHNSSPNRRFWGYTKEEVANEKHHASDGRVGMWLDFGTLASDFYSDAGTTILAAPPPLGNAGVSAHDMEQNGLFIAAHTEEPQACWTWLRYLSQQRTTIPGMAHARLATDAAVAPADQPAHTAAAIHQAYREVLTQTPPREGALQPYIEPYWLFRAVDHALQGKDVDTELDDAQAFTEQYLSCVRGGGQPRSCALTVDPDYDGHLIDAEDG